jgi:TRAP-type C4-dicarboxylate transport system permease small subunit
MAHLTMFVIFYANVITRQIFNLPHTYRNLVEKNYFLR